MVDIDKIKGAQLSREMTVAGNVDEEARTVELAFSSEAPVERYFGLEVLDHGPRAVRLDRIKDSAPLLADHDPKRQIGVVQSVSIGADRIGRATVKFSRGALGSEYLQDVVDGIRTHVSVGYVIHDAVLERGDPDVIRATDWEPLEVSMVSIPADRSVGVGRSAAQQQQEVAMTDKTKQLPADNAPAKDDGAIQTRAVANDKPAAVDTAEQKRVEEIGTIARHFALEKLGDDHVIAGTSVADFRAIVRTAAADRLQPVPVAPRIEMAMPRRSKTLQAFRPELYGSMREADEAAYRAGQWARAAIFGDQQASAWCRDYGVRVMTGLSGSTSSVVPDEMVLPIIDLREQYGVARRLCYVYPMASDTAIVPRRASGVTAYFAGRETATTESEMGFDDIQLVARELSALTRVSNSYMEDAVIDLGDQLAMEMAYAFAVKEDACLIDGDGTSMYGGIYGIRPKIIDGTHTAGAIDAASGHDTFAEIDATDLANVQGALPEYPGIQPVWLASKRSEATVFGRLRQSLAGDKADAGGGAGRKTWDGDEIVTSQAMPKGPASTDYSNVVMLVYGDLRMGVTMGDRRGFEVQVLRERYAEYRQTGIIATERFDLVVHGLGDTSNAGPIVALVGE